MTYRKCRGRTLILVPALLALLTGADGARAANPIVPTAPPGTSTNQAASTAFVQNALATSLPLPSGQIYIGSVANLATAQTLSGSGDCTVSLANNGVATFICTKTNGVAFSALATTTPGTGVSTALGVNVGTAGAPVVNGGVLGTPSSGVATNLTGTAAGLTAGNVTTNANLTGAVTSTGNATSLGSFTSANLRGALTDETGTGAAYFQGGDIGTPSAGVGTNLTALNGSNINSGTVANARLTGSGSATVAGQTCTLGSTCGLSSLTNSLGANVSMNNTANYFDGPSVAQGTTGTWYASGSVLVSDTAVAAGILCKLWDGTTVIASGGGNTTAATSSMTVALSGVITSPAANIKISCRDTSAITGTINFNASANGKDSTVTAVRIN